VEECKAEAQRAKHMYEALVRPPHPETCGVRHADAGGLLEELPTPEAIRHVKRQPAAQSKVKKATESRKAGTISWVPGSKAGCVGHERAGAAHRRAHVRRA
jgi:hypothetical protein